jgi:PTS system fructose-specific IIC component
VAPVITAELVRIDADLGTAKQDVIRALAALVASGGRATDEAQLVADAFAREETSATGLKGGIAIPHCRTTGVDLPTIAFARLSAPVDFGAKDGPADLVFLIAAPEGGDATHLQLLTKLARALVKSEFTASLRAAGTAEEVAAVVQGVVEPETAAVPAATPAAAPTAAAPAPAAGPTRRLVAVTACPTGIAHTYMAAESLEAAAERAGVEMQVETQGSAGSKPLAPAVIEAADAVIFATDVGVRDRSRFAGKPVVVSGVKRPIDDGDTMIAEALRYADDPGAPRVEGRHEAAGESTSGTESWGARVRRVLMTGVSYMIPFVAAGGLLIALAFLLGGYEIALPIGADGSGGSVINDIVANHSLLNLPDAGAYELKDGATLTRPDLLVYLAALLLTLGGAAFTLFVPALAGYIAYAIADRPGIAPGFVMGWVASQVIPAGFLGGIVGGTLAGLSAHWIASRPVPAWARGLMPVLVIPLFATVISGFLMLVVLNRPLVELQSGLENGLRDMSGSYSILLGIVVGLMMAFDMGGPLNKAAYAVATAGLSAAATATGAAPELKLMGAVMLAGMVPPIALALATVVRPKLFSPAERENGKAAWLLGASFITEGAIPFAAADPLRVIPSIMLGSAVTGGLAQALDVSLRAPHGGIFVLFAVDNVLGFLLALVAGVLVAAASVVALKTVSHAQAEVETV